MKKLCMFCILMAGILLVSCNSINRISITESYQDAVKEIQKSTMSQQDKTDCIKKLTNQYVKDLDKIIKP